MDSLFGGGARPAKVIEPPKKGDKEIQEERAREAARLRSARGRGSLNLTGAQGVLSLPSVGVKRLLGE